MDLGEGVSRPEARKSQKSVEKSLPKPGPKSLKKVSKKVRKVKKKSENGFSETFRTFFETFFGLSGPGPGRLFRDFFQDFLAFGPETPSPRPTEPQNSRFRHCVRVAFGREGEDVACTAPAPSVWARTEVQDSSCAMRHQKKIRKIPAPIKIKSALPPPPKTQINPPPPKRRNLYCMDMGFLLQKERIFPGAHKIGAAISRPRIADKKFYGHEDFSENGKVNFLYRYRPEGIFRFFFGLILDPPPRYICFYSEKRQSHLYRPFFFPWHGLFRKKGGTGAGIRFYFPCEKIPLEGFLQLVRFEERV